nr:hypothetical protein [Tanacetum cinerariifolium]
LGKSIFSLYQALCEFGSPSPPVILLELCGFLTFLGYGSSGGEFGMGKTSVGGKKVVKSTSKDHVFVYNVGHAGKEILEMPTVELEKSHLLAMSARMEQQEQCSTRGFTSVMVHEICNPPRRTRYGMSSRRVPWTGHVLVVPSSLTFQRDETSRVPLSACQESPYP